MLQLSEELFIGRGNKRIVYAHPDDPSCCLKVINPENTPEKLRRRKSWLKRWRPLRYFDDNFLELREYRRICRIAPEARACFAVMHGMVETDRGWALKEELIRNADGRVSPHLQDFLARHGQDQKWSERLCPVVSRFVGLLRSSPLMLRDLNLRNTVLQDRGQTLRIVIIDGLGTYAVAPMEQWFASLAQKRMRVKTSRFLGHLPFKVE